MGKLIAQALLEEAAARLLAADAATLAPAANANHVHLMALALNPLTYQFNAADEATFTGGAAKDAGLGTQTVYLDTDTAEWVLQLKPPAGGWTWVCTVTPGAPQTVAAICVTDNADAVTLGSMLLTAGPTQISAAGDGVAEGTIELRFPVSFLQ